MFREEIPYTPNGLMKSFHKARNFRARFNVTSDEVEQGLAEVCNKLHKGSYNFSNLNISTLNGNRIHTISNYEDDILLMHCFTNLRRSFDITFPDRRRITDQIKTLLDEQVPFTIYRLDIKSFYENISKERAYQAICENLSLNPLTKLVVDKILNHPQLQSIKHLPRGLSISAILSEIFMMSFDERIRKQKEFYYYTRFVDDIVIFSSNTRNNQLSMIEGLINSMGLQLNKAKCCRIVKKCDEPDHKRKMYCRCTTSLETFDYLGYEFAFVDRPNQKNHACTKVEISSKKLKRHKSRIVKSIISYHHRQDFYLLRDRIRFLTANYWIRSQVQKSNLRSGFYFNYPLLTNESESLKKLDRFLYTKLYSKSGPSKLRLGGHLGKYHSAVLSKYSFVKAFENRITYWFSENRLKEIKKCWRDEKN